jgi:methyl-accepting chemotaxis protein
MKKLTLVILAIMILTLSACKLVDDGKQSINNVKEEVNNVVETADTIKGKFEETAKDINSAVDSMKNTSTAIKEIVK